MFVRLPNGGRMFWRLDDGDRAGYEFVEERIIIFKILMENLNMGLKKQVQVK